MMHCALAETDMSSAEYVLASEWFHEAQQQELAGNVKVASDLYERALSQRRCAYAAASTSVADVSWSHALFFLSYLDLRQVRACSKMLRALVQRNEAIRKVRWNKSHPLMVIKPEMPATWSRQDLVQYVTKIQAIARTPVMLKLLAETFPLLPLCMEDRGTTATFVYTRSTFDVVPDACLRTLAMAAIARFVIGRDKETYVAHYDPFRKRALACLVSDLLMAAFYERPVGGVWRVVYGNDRDKCDEHKSNSTEQARILDERHEGVITPHTQSIPSYTLLRDALACPFGVDNDRMELSQWTKNDNDPPSYEGEIKRMPPLAGILPGFTVINNEVTGQVIFDFERARLGLREVLEDDQQLPCSCVDKVKYAKHRHWFADITPVFGTSPYPPSFFHAEGGGYELEETSHRCLVHVHILLSPTPNVKTGQYQFVTVHRAVCSF
jgi:hypothetical protein